MRSVLNDFGNFRKQRFQHSFNDNPIISLYCLFYELKRTDFRSRKLSVEKSQYFSDNYFDFGVFRVFSKVTQQQLSIFYFSEFGNIKEVFDIIHKLLLCQLVDRWKSRLHLSVIIIMKGLSQFTELSVRQFKGSLDIRYGVRQISMGKRLIFALVVTSQNFLVIDLHSQDISAVIRRGAYPKLGKISSCERFFLASFSDNTVFLYNTRTGDPITKILGIPRGVNNFALAGNSSRIFYASNNIVCLWSVAKGQLELSSQQWRNINCFAIDDQAERIALGTYSGKIVILTMLSTTKVTQMELSRHRNCVMQVTFSGKNKIFSISYDKIFLTSTIETNSKGQKSIIYEELQLESVPRSIKAVCDCPYLIENQGMFWIVQGNKLRGFSQGHYGITEVEGVVYLIRYHAGKIEWFRK